MWAGIRKSLPILSDWIRPVLQHLPRNPLEARSRTASSLRQVGDVDLAVSVDRGRCEKWEVGRIEGLDIGP